MSSDDFLNDSDEFDPDSKTQVHAYGFNEKSHQATVNLTPEMSYPVRIGHYRLIKKLGEGGMGVVFLANDEIRQKHVALKILAKHVTPNEASVNRFIKEARLLSEIRHPCVAQLEEAGNAEGTCYLAIEYVDGINLEDGLNYLRVFSEVLALGIVRDIALGVAELHRLGIVHRDIKPANILLSIDPIEGKNSREAVQEALLAGQKPVVKLTDFGLARHIDQTQSMRLTQAGAILGTPAYLAPEQCSDQSKICPATDVYALGVTLFELLSGRTPFKTPDLASLLNAHCRTPPPDLQKLNPDASSGVAALVAKALEKPPEARFHDAGHLISEIDRVLNDELKVIVVHPLVPVTHSSIVETDWEWDLQSSAEELWPLVSNTDRINSGAGFPAVTYFTERSEQGTLEQFGTFTLGWSKLVWQEHPYEWIEGRRFGVLREFRKGPFVWFLSTVELIPQEDGGTKLVHSVRIAPKGYMGKLLAYLEVKIKGAKALNLVYRRIDEQLIRERDGGKKADPFLSPVALSAHAQAVLTSRIAKLQEFQVSDECVAVLKHLLEHTPPLELARIRPLVVARLAKLPQDDLIAAFLLATQTGLLTLHWDIICPTCRVSTSLVNTLKSIEEHAYCEACDLDFILDFGRAVELIFQSDAEIRAADLKTYCIGGPEHAPHVITQIILRPNEVLDLELALTPGAYNLRGPQLPYVLQLNVIANVGVSSMMIPMSPDYSVERLPILRAGGQFLEVINRFPHDQLIRIERTTPRRDVLTAADASRIPQFIELFPKEVLSPDQLTDVIFGTVIAVEIRNSQELFKKHDEVVAHQKLKNQLKSLHQIGGMFQGTVIRESEERIQFLFVESQKAMSFFRFLLNRTSESMLFINECQFGFVFHQCRVRVSVVNGIPEYFGEQLNVTNELRQNCFDASVVVSKELGQQKFMQETFADLGLELEFIDEAYWKSTV